MRQNEKLVKIILTVYRVLTMSMMILWGFFNSWTY